MKYRSIFSSCFLLGFLIYILPNFVLAAPNFPYGGVAVMHQSGCAETDYAAASDTDSARGTALLNAISAGTNGDTLYLSKGTFDVGDTQIDLSLGYTGTVNMHGVGKASTTITFTSNGVRPGLNGGVVSDLTLQTSGFDTPFGTLLDSHDYLDLWLANVDINGYSDGIHFSGTGRVDLTCINVNVTSSYDDWNMTGPGDRRLYNCNFTATDHGSFANNPARAMEDLSASSINVWNSTFTATSDGGYSSQCYGARVINGANFYNSHVNAYSPEPPHWNHTGNNWYWIYPTAGFLATDVKGSGKVNVSPSTTYNSAYGTPNVISEVPMVVPSLPAEICPKPSLDAKDIIAFSFQGLNPAVTATINGTAIAATVPYGTNITNLVATFATTGGSVTVGATSQASGTTTNDFTNPVTYTVTAADATTQNYIVTVTVAANAAPTPTPTPSAPPASYSSSGGSAQSRVSNLLSMGFYSQAQDVARQYNIAIPTSATSTTSITSTSSTISASSTFTRSLDIGSVGPDVKTLQVFLNTHGYVIAESGPGSLGHETDTFGSLTKKALAKFQKANQIAPAVGHFGPITQAKVNGMVNH